jgi:hypothetical protein
MRADLHREMQSFRSAPSVREVEGRFVRLSTDRIKTGN